MSVSAQAAPGTRVLIVDDEDNQRSGLSNMVSGWGFSVDTARDGLEALEKIDSFDPQVMLTDMMMPRMDGAELMKKLLERGSRMPVIVITAFGNIETALTTTHDLGAFWFLEKPIQGRVLRFLLERAAAQTKLADEAEGLRRQLSYQGVLGELVGNAEPMQQVFSLIRQVAPTRAAVLVTGESGTGKEMVARAIHQLSPRAKGPFVAINCAALPETLMESELFGHEKGAFTGAVERRAGCFELAQGGTLLLDELAEMPIGTQAKLLRVLEDSRVRRLGGKAEMLVDVRVIAATNRPPEEAIKKGMLREDLYYRLNVFGLELPPLRRRLEDLPILAEAILNDMNAKHGIRVAGFEPEVLVRMQRHSWPGNVRELRNVLERAAIIAGSGLIGPQHLPASMGVGAGLGLGAAVPQTAAPSAGPLAGATAAAAVGLPPAVGDGVLIPVGTRVDQAEKSLILMTLAHTKNNKTRAADILGISLKTLFNKLKEYGSAAAETES
jgi:DNA-binding NtrC family response regulator